MTSVRHDVLILNPADDVALAIQNLPAGSLISGGEVSLQTRNDIPAGHKIAIRPKTAGDVITKYGHAIGIATGNIKPGDWVHSHNLSVPQEARSLSEAHRGGEASKSTAPREKHTEQCTLEPSLATFQGYRRANGKAGTRNYIAVISSVNCSASVSRYITSRFPADELRRYPNIDGLLPLTHKGGCGLQFGGASHKQLARVLAGFAQHPNVAGFLLVGLGCETGTLSYIIEQGGLSAKEAQPNQPQVHELRSWDQPQPDGPIMLSIQDCGGTQKTVEAGIAAISKLLPAANDVRREPIPAAELILGLECGGSDAWSGITANPALGIASDLLVSAGGTAVLSETPEIYGAEHLLAARASTPEVAEKLFELVRWWEDYAGRHGVSLDNNPSPGNKAGGLTTIFEKSLGAVAKGGISPLADVVQYAEPITSRGFVFMDSPGYDPASITGMVASGANVVCFTTGRGSCFGCKPTPSIKIATNTPMYERMRDDMDINAGVAITGTPLARVGREIFETILEVASGRKTKSEEQGLGEEEFAPWDLGPTL